MPKTNPPPDCKMEEDGSKHTHGSSLVTASSGALLAFNAPGLEAKFIVSATPSWVKIDTMIFAIAVVVGPSKILSWNTQGVHKALLHHSWLILSSVACSLAFLQAIRTRTRWYSQNRVAMLSVFRIFLAVGTSMIMWIEDPLDVWLPVAGAPTMLLRIFCRTSITPLWSSALGLQIPFKRHIWIHGLSTALSMLWVPNLSRACDSNATTVWCANQLGWWTEWLMQRALVLGLPFEKMPAEDGAYPCILVGMFFHCWLGFALPTLGLYAMEVISRSEYLVNSMGIHDRDARMYKIGGLIVGGLYFVVGSQLLWFISKSIVVGGVPRCGRVPSES